MHSAILRLCAALLLAAPLGAQAPCGAWNAAFPAPGVDQPFESYVTHDDGTGPALYAAGRFTTIGDQRIEGVARWDGVRWTQVGTGLSRTLRLASYADGTGPKLYVTGDFRVSQGAPADGFARWDGTGWSAVPGGPAGTLVAIQALVVHDDGTGPRLYLAGLFQMPQFGASARRVVSFDGSVWTDLSLGLPTNTSATSLASFDAGSGSRLYVGYGDGLAPPTAVFRRNGANWVAATNGLADAQVSALATYASGGTNALYAAGQFLFGGVRHAIARYDGSAWSAVGTGLTQTTDYPRGYALAVHADGSGTRLVAGGAFDRAGALATRGLASWDGATWSVPGALLGPEFASVVALASHDDGAGRALHVSGSFTLAGRTPVQHAARLRAGIWERIASGDGATASVTIVRALDDGSGQALFVSGGFSGIGSAPIHGIARWSGTTWSALGDPQDTVGQAHALTAFDDGTGLDLWALGPFTRIGGVAADGFARWDGTRWIAPGPGLGGVPSALVVHDDGSGRALYGATTYYHQGVSIGWLVARWNGTSWTPIASESSGAVADLAVHDDGGGARLYACGTFTSIGGAAVPGLARWNGTQWSAVGAASIAVVQNLWDLEVHDQGAGTRLYVSGILGLTGVAHWTSVARWDGVAWSEVADDTLGASALQSYRDGGGPRLAAVANVATWPQFLWNVRVWDGASWSDLGAPGAGYPRTIARFDAARDGVAELYVGGDLSTAGGLPAGHLARFDPCATPAVVVCAGDGSGASCPCANAGATGHGCANSVHAVGARLASGGFASIAEDTLVLHGTDMPNGSALYFQGTSQLGGGLGSAFGDGLRCAGGTVIRLGTKLNVAGASSYPASGETPISIRGANAAGNVRTYQAWYRNAAAFCTPGTFNLTNGLQIAWSN